MRQRPPHTTNWSMWFGILHKVTAAHIIVIRLTKNENWQRHYYKSSLISRLVRDEAI